MTFPTPATGTEIGVGESVIDWRYKSFPPAVEGMPVSAARSAGLSLRDFSTPIAVLNEPALAHNLALMQRFCAERGVVHAPHGKTTMSPELIARQLQHGVWGMTAATAWQARAMITMGAPRVIIANECLDPSGLAWLLTRMRDDPGVQVYVFADSVEAVHALRDIVAGVDGAPALGVLVELGVGGGRAGARTVSDAVEVGEAIAASAGLEPAGVAGFEGVIGPGRDAQTKAGVHAFLAGFRAVARELTSRQVLPTSGPVLLSAGGSMFFDLVADGLTTIADRLNARATAGVQVVIRPGCYLTHDHGLYHHNTPLAGPGGLRPAMRVWAHVLSTPQPRLAIIDAGKRDIGSDTGMPPALRRRRDGHDDTLDADAVVTERLNDQHGYLHVATPGLLRVGDLVELGVSHPCTTFDKWRAIPILDDHDRLVDVAHTAF